MANIIADEVLASTPLHHVRTSCGDTIQKVMDRQPHGSSVVPSLGHVVDTMLDSFGYTAAFCRLLHSSYRGSNDVQEFAQQMRTQISILEAEWYWNNICIAEEDTYRNRRTL